MIWFWTRRVCSIVRLKYEIRATMSQRIQKFSPRMLLLTTQLFYSNFKFTLATKYVISIEWMKSPISHSRLLLNDSRFNTSACVHANRKRCCWFLYQCFVSSHLAAWLVRCFMYAFNYLSVVFRCCANWAARSCAFTVAQVFLFFNSISLISSTNRWGYAMSFWM